MTVKTIAFFSSRGGVGNTSLVYHAAWMLAQLGRRVLAVDLDPQANLSVMALGYGERLESLWPDNDPPRTLYGAVAPLFDGTGDNIRPAHIESLSDELGLLAGDLALSRIESGLAAQWPRCFEGDERALRLTAAFGRVIQEAAQRHQADVVILDVGPNLGAINRSALIASSHIVVPVTYDLFSMQALDSLGPTLDKWRQAWRHALARAPASVSDLPQGQMTPIGYVLMQQDERQNQSFKAYAKWRKRLPECYRESVMGEQGAGAGVGVGAGVDVDAGAAPDSNQIQCIQQYRGLMSMAMESRRPVFGLTVADGAIGALRGGVERSRDAFEALICEILRRVDSDEAVDWE